MRADEVAVALVVGMHGDARIAEHGLGAGRGDRDGPAGRLPVPVDDGVAEMPEAPFGLDLHHLDVGHGGEQLRVPVDQPLVAIDQPLLVQGHEHPAHRMRQALVHGEALARPVAGRAEPAQLLDDRSARLGLPGPNAFEKLLPPHRPAIGLLVLHELALDHHLGRDAGMVGTGLPQHISAAHALVAAQDVLQRVVERVPHVQHAGDVRRRDNHREGLCVGAVRAPRLEGLGLLPNRRDPRLDGGGIEGLIHVLR